MMDRQITSQDWNLEMSALWEWRTCRMKQTDANKDKRGDGRENFYLAFICVTNLWKFKQRSQNLSSRQVAPPRLSLRRCFWHRFHLHLIHPPQRFTQSSAKLCHDKLAPAWSSRNRLQRNFDCEGRKTSRVLIAIMSPSKTHKKKLMTRGCTVQSQTMTAQLKLQNTKLLESFTEQRKNPAAQYSSALFFE